MRTTTHPVRSQITKRIDHALPEARLYKHSEYRDARFVTEINTTWTWVDGVWRMSRLGYVSSLPKQDGTPSARWTTELVIGGEDKFFDAFPEAAVPPTERITLTIEGAE